jgi:hypothetical protein
MIRADGKRVSSQKEHRDLPSGRGLGQTVVSIITAIPAKRGQLAFALYAAATTGFGFGLDPLWTYGSAVVFLVVSGLFSLAEAHQERRHEKDRTEEHYRKRRRRIESGER